MPLHPYGPEPVSVFAAGGEHGLVSVAVGGEPACTDGLLSFVDDLDGGGTFVRIHTDDDLAHPGLPSSSRQELSARRAPLLRAGHTPVESLSAPR
jgi:hypothetical protein